MQVYHDEAIVLRSSPFKEYDRILQIFSKERGILTAYVRGASRPSHPLHGISQPCIEGAFSYRETRGETVRITEGKVLLRSLRLRERLSSLQGAMRLCQATGQFLQPKTPSIKLYQLLRGYLEQIPLAPFPGVLEASYLLKLLLLEGLWSPHHSCDQCNQEIEESLPCFFAQGNLYCSQCHPQGSLCFEPGERVQMLFLTHVRSWNQLIGCPEIPDFRKKIERLFEEKALEKESARGGT